MKNGKRWGFVAILAGLVVVMGLLVGLYFYVPPYAQPVVVEEPVVEEPEARAVFAKTWNTSSITDDTTIAGILTQAYSYHDIGCAIDMSDTNTITVKIQSSPDNSDWFDQLHFEAQIADASIFTRTLCYFRYTRVVLDVTTNDTITPVCKSTFSNNWYPYDTTAQTPQNQQ